MAYITLNVVSKRFYLIALTPIRMYWNKTCIQKIKGGLVDFLSSFNLP